MRLKALQKALAKVGAVFFGMKTWLVLKAIRHCGFRQSSVNAWPAFHFGGLAGAKVDLGALSTHGW